MTSSLTTLSTSVIERLADMLEGGSLTVPCTAASLQPHVPGGSASAVAGALAPLAGPAGAVQLAAVLRLLLAERAEARARAPQVDLVWSGPETSSLNRDTVAVVRELIERARRTVLIAAYALDEGEKAHAILAPLAARLDRGDPLDVALFLNVHPSVDAAASPSTTVAEFTERFRTRVWPGRRLPRAYYDPRSLQTSGPTRASMHAKCIVIDETASFVTSANLTQAAQWRNVEVGVVVESPALARDIRAQFLGLVDAGILCEVPA